MAKTVKIEDLDKYVEEILDEYVGEVNENLHDTTVDVGKAGLSAIRKASKATFDVHNKQKPYWKGWRLKDYSDRMTTQIVIHNASVPGLPHLLEFGHEMRGGGRSSSDKNFVEGRVHIKTVQDKIEKMLERKLKVEL